MLPQLRLHSAPSEQIHALRALKNEIIGHPLKKEATVALGVLDTVVRLSTNKTTSRNDSKLHDYTFASRPLSEEQIVRLLGLQVIASIAMGGPVLSDPTQSASVVPAVLSNLCPSSNPAQLVLASLRALSNLTDSFALAANIHTVATSAFAEAIFVRIHLNSLCRILSQTSASTTVQCQISIAASLISRVCREERHQQGLANSGVLDALATRLASFVVAEGLVVPGAEILAERDGLQEYIPQAAPPNANLSIILEAISVIIADSKFRASQLLYSPSILAIFPMSQSTEFVANRGTRAAWNAFNAAGLSARQSQLNAVDFLLPCVPCINRKLLLLVSAFPPLGTSGSRESLAHNGRKFNSASTASWSDSISPDTSMPSHESTSSDIEDPESPLVAYLIWLLRSRFSTERLMAASVLTVLYRAGLTHKSRETAIGLLVVPLLVNMLDDIVMPSNSKDNLAEAEATSVDRAMKEKAPAILAMLITDSEYLQKAAFDANLISKLSKMLKTSYDPIPETSRSHQWSPHVEGNLGNREISPSSRLGHHGQCPLLCHRIKVRESTLKTIAALIPFKDDYRKAIVDQGMIPYIVESLSSTPSKPTSKVGEKSDQTGNRSREDNGKQQYGINPISVLIAACGAIRALSRSVSILRTTLIDNGVAMPIFTLLQHPDVEVQIAATATVCNLVIDVSPMREMITEAGVLKILCEHAHSMNAKLRLNALWALKHFVHDVSNDMKRSCLEELGQGWLVQLICDDTEDEALFNSKGEDAMSAALDLSEEIDQDVEMHHLEDFGDSALVGGSFSQSITRPRSSRSRSVQHVEMRLAALRDAETNPARKARKDDIAVQEQGLDFIRNLISGAGHGGTTETTEMIDFLFNALGQDRVFEILASKLRPKVINPFHRRGSTSVETKVIPPQSEIITAVGYILVHMAGSIPRHRQLVIAQTDVLKLLVQQFGHPSAEVRLVLCHLVINLTWRDDSNDSQACAQRANELKKIGFLSKLEMLEQDPELNVRQQAKTALWQMKQGYH